jgi:hypothetical protein
MPTRRILVACWPRSRPVRALPAQDDRRPAAPDSARALSADTTVGRTWWSRWWESPVLASPVDEELFSRQAQGVKLPDTPEGLPRCAGR